MSQPRQFTFIGLDRFDKRLAKLAGKDARAGLEAALTGRPDAGDVIVGSGGARKLRWARPGTGKSGGVRIIYYFHDGKSRIWLIDVYAKNEKDDLTGQELNRLAKLIKDLKEQAS